MLGIRTLARSLISSLFIVAGVNTLMKARQIASTADDIAQPIAHKLGLSTDTETLVKVHAGTQVVGGALFALGVVPRITGLVLAGSLVPTTMAGHRFWEQDDIEARTGELIDFLKNAAILGGLVYVALDTGGRPSVFWAGRKAAIGAGASIGATARSVADSVTPH